MIEEGREREEVRERRERDRWRERQRGKERERSTESEIDRLREGLLALEDARKRRVDWIDILTISKFYLN